MSAVFVFDASGDLTVFTSEAIAAGWLEAADVDEGEYEAAYLQDGTVVELAAADERVVLRRTARNDLPGLMARSRACRRATGGGEDIGDLLDFADEVLRVEWERRWPRPPRWFPGKGPPRVER